VSSRFPQLTAVSYVRASVHYYMYGMGSSIFPHEAHGQIRSATSNQTSNCMVWIKDVLDAAKFVSKEFLVRSGYRIWANDGVHSKHS
jgi:hypothetical protein